MTNLNAAYLAGPIVLNDATLWSRSSDWNHGLGDDGPNNRFAGDAVDGPVFRRRARR